MKISKYKHNDWVVYFSGTKLAPLAFSNWITVFTRRPFTKKLDYFLNQLVVVWDGEITTGYVRNSDRETFGRKVITNVINDPNYIDSTCQGLIKAVDHVLAIYNKEQKEFSYQEYADYNSYFLNNYCPYHIQVKNVVDFLPKNLLDIYLPKLEEARVYAEPVFSKETGFMKKVADYISQKSDYKPEHILHCFNNELTAYWRDGKKLPSEDILAERYKGSVSFFEQGEIQDVLVGEDTAQLATIFPTNDSSKAIKGQTAFKGKAKGTVRIIIDPSEVKEFNNGDILVAPWTRPEYLPIMKKAGAFVTDGGGILSHAAIVARELKKPCVIATNNSTKVLKDGDIVEVDADKGIIKKL